MQKYSDPKFIIRLSLFIVYFWFGALKVIGMSPAHELVGDLLVKTLPFIPEDIFNVGLGLFEMLIGILWLTGKFDRAAFYITCLHLFTTFGPMVFLPDISWKAVMVPTLVGQYILKNVLIFACGYSLFAFHQRETSKANS